MFSANTDGEAAEQYEKLNAMIWGYNVAAFGLASAIGLGGLALGVI